MIKMDIPSTVYGYQIHYAFKTSIVNLLIKDNCSYDQFIRREPFALSDEIDVIGIKPAGNQEVIMVVLELDFSVDDKVIFKYVEKFGGKMVNQRVQYGRDKQRPFLGF